MLARKITIFMLAVSLAAQLGAKELDSKLEKTAQKFALAAVAQRLEGSTLAVFPFQADDKLSKKKVNVAVSEILTNSLLRQSAFKLIERARLEEVMKEQKLGLSGAVDSKTAADVGKLMGAKLLVLGNVIQVGNSYQITSKLVNSETSEILTSEISEVPVKTFDEDAERYLVLVPDTQAIGVYVAKGFIPVSATTPKAVTNPQGTTITPSGGAFRFNFAGIGAKYFVTSKWVVDAFYGLQEEFQDTTGFTVVNGASIRTFNDGLDTIYNNNSMYRISLNRVMPVSGKFRVNAGVGYMSLTLDSDTIPGGCSIAYSGGGVTAIYNKNSWYYTSPFLSFGLEYRPMTRLGISVLGSYNLIKKDLKDYATVREYSGPTDLSRTDVLVQQFTIPQLLFNAALSLYF
ncbi:MAG: CsgG/HfaB family protein [Elusimicrobiota bacterium]|nr:CsgG/HfaB family protein [Elusimicrobiota bacterium]